MKITKEGIAVIEGDNYLSNDIIQAGRLDVARDFLLQFKEYIPVGGVVADVGACLGDFTATFSEFVGPSGRVYAFEPNLPVVDCLYHNMRPYLYWNVVIYSSALGARNGMADIITDHNNIGASRLVDGNGPLHVWALDNTAGSWQRLDFMKLDTEGWEPHVLAGGKETIMRLRPVMLIEINPWMLGKQNFTPEDIYSRLDALEYSFPRFDGPHGDILCIPKERD